MTLNWSLGARTVQANAIIALAGSNATIQYWSTLPATPDTAESGTLLGTAQISGALGTLGNSGGVITITLDPISTATASNSGTVASARIMTLANVPIMDLDCGTSGTALIFNTTAISAGGPIIFTSCVITISM